MNVDKYLTRGLIGLVQLYRYAFSPLMASRCRYYPTCSSYALEALRMHGAWRGGYLTLRRLFRCHPWGGSGIDFVPLPLYRQRFYYYAAKQKALGVWRR